jgi:hypothetical protein
MQGGDTADAAASELKRMAGEPHAGGRHAGVSSSGSQGDLCSMLRKTPNPISMACA